MNMFVFFKFRSLSAITAIIRNFILPTLISVIFISCLSLPAVAAETSLLDDQQEIDEDWVWLGSGEFLIGEIKNLYDEKLEFKSDDLSTLKIKWDDIKRIHSQQTFTVRTTDNELITGTVTLDNGIVIITNNRKHQVQKDEIFTLIAGLESGENIWDGKITFGANISSGNTDKLEFNTKAELNRHTTTSRIKSEYTAIIAETSDVQTDENHRLTLTYDVYHDKEVFFRPVDLLLFRDPFQNVSHRISLGLGFGYKLIDDDERELEVNLGPSYLYTKYEHVEPGENPNNSSIAVTMGANYELEINDKVDLELDYRLTTTEEDLGKYLHNSKASFDIELTDVLDFDITFNWDRVQSPLNDINGNPLKKDDFRLSFGLGVSFN